MAHLHQESSRFFAMNFPASSKHTVVNAEEEGPAFETRETALAVELWRVRGCPEGDMPECVALASEIASAAKRSC
jgi:hypothetical protein